MWRCSNCGTGIEDKYAHCWQCGAPNVVKQRTQTATPKARTARPQAKPARPEEKSVPGFASYEELAHVPSRPMWFLRRGPLQRLFYFLLAIILVKVFGSPFLGKYGVYIVAGVAVIALIMILWGFFRRDPQEGIGIKLN
jgi:DNA-directed RNA polymerase subunit RPC12/RpoP